MVSKKHHKVLLVHDLDTVEVVDVAGPYWNAQELLHEADGVDGAVSFTMARGPVDKKSEEFYKDADFFELVFDVADDAKDSMLKGPAVIMTHLCDNEDRAVMDWTDYDRFFSHDRVLEIVRDFLSKKRDEFRIGWYGTGGSYYRNSLSDALKGALGLPLTGLPDALDQALPSS